MSGKYIRDILLRRDAIPAKRLFSKFGNKSNPLQARGSHPQLKQNHQWFTEAGWNLQTPVLLVRRGLSKQSLPPTAPQVFKLVNQGPRIQSRFFQSSGRLKPNSPPNKKYSGDVPPVKSVKDIVRTLEASGSNTSGPRMPNLTELLVKPIAFTAFVAGSTFVGCAIWQYEEIRDRVSQGLLNPQNWRIPRNVGADQTVNPFRLNKVGSIRNQIHSWWTQASVGDRIFWPICGVNALVYILWRVPRLSNTMVTYFAATPNSRAICSPMLLSTFSHYSFYHLAINMFVLHSFIPAATNILGKEHFLGMYLTAGVVSSLGSHMHKLYIGSNIPSLGASGAIMGILGFVCTKLPDIQLGIVFLPGVQFTADTALKCILAVDSFGLLFGWKFMDHAAHLTGALFGIGFAHMEPQLESVRSLVLNSWHKFRTNSNE